MKRRDALLSAVALAAAGCSQTRRRVEQTREETKYPPLNEAEEYVWISANADLPLFVASDHPALHQIGRELGVKVTIAGPSTIDIPGLVATIDQTAARRPAGMMVVGWDPSALVSTINAAIDSGVPVVCVDADVPASNRLAFIGTDWFEIGERQAREMLKALGTRRGKVVMLGLIEQYIDQRAFAGFRSVAEPAGLQVLPPLQDKGNQSDAARVAAAVMQANPDLVGMAGFDSESGAGMGEAIRESGRTGKIVATCVDSEPQQLRFIKEGVLTASVGQKRKLFTYEGVRALHQYVHNTLRFTPDDKRAGISPIPVTYNTGTFIVDRSNVDIFLAGGAGAAR